MGTFNRIKKFAVTLADSADDKLRREAASNLPAFSPSAAHELGRPREPSPYAASKLLIRRKVGQPCLIGSFEVQGYTVGQLNCPLDVLERRTRDKLEVDVAGVALLEPKALDGGQHLLHGGIGVGHDPRGEEQAINPLLLIERDKCGCQLIGLEGSALALNRA